jgi:hypothetical protein
MFVTSDMHRDNIDPMFFFLDGLELKEQNDDILVLIDGADGLFHYFRIGSTLVSFYADGPKNLNTISLDISNMKSKVSLEIHKMFPETYSIPPPV